MMLSHESEFNYEPELQGKYLRWTIYLLIIAASSAWSVYRIYQVNVYDEGLRNVKSSEGSPLLCANDRSRWCTIRALGDDDSYEIDKIIADPETGEFSFDQRKYNPFWATIDLVKHRDKDGEMHFYSSKPTLLPTMLGWLYKSIKWDTGKNLTDDTFEVVRLMLLLVNVMPMALFLVLFAGILEVIAVSSFTRYTVLSFASFGTFMTPFMVTLNNHLPAAFSVGVSLFALVHILCRKKEFAGHYFVAGFFAAFAAANELPALSYFCFVGFILVLCSWRRTLLLFVPGAAVVVFSFFWTNHAAHDDWMPPYVHRSDGPVITTIDEKVFAELQAGEVSDGLLAVLENHHLDIGFKVTAEATVHEGQMPLAPGVIERYVLTPSGDANRLAIVKRDSGLVEVRQWDNWYEYPESRWLLNKKAGVDKGEESPADYALHCLVGHHGIFSLTPFWILSLLGFLFLFQGKMKRFSWIGVMTILVTGVVVYFYLSRPLEDRNYGGGTSGLRWLLWLAPLWMMAAVPFVDWISRSIWGRISCWILLLASVASAGFSAFNPWVHPWLYDLMVHLDWIQPF
ncbi:hypothetical protein OAG56_04440 [Mariniblastus sp.]|nr:hypothetical protein [Mariniblastus sp.]MDB4671638.1 hypothetical protein [Pirellulaceae bacterium]MDB4756600.1 hypothetical protein [Mariniblastus sp.]